MPGLQRHAPSAAINVTPMIDVMLVLLIIFMVVVPVLAAYDALPPEARTRAPTGESGAFTLGIDSEGRFWLGDEPVEPEQLGERLRRAYAGVDGERLLRLRADRAVPYARVLDVLDAARSADVRSIGAIAAPPGEENH